MDRERERGAFQSCGSLLLLLLFLFPPSESIVKNFSKCIPAKTLQRSIISSVLFLENAFFIFALGFKVDCAFLNKEKKKSSHVPKKEEKGSKDAVSQSVTQPLCQSGESEALFPVELFTPPVLSVPVEPLGDPFSPVTEGNAVERVYSPDEVISAAIQRPPTLQNKYYHIIGP